MPAKTAAAEKPGKAAKAADKNDEKNAAKPAAKTAAKAAAKDSGKEAGKTEAKAAAKPAAKSGGKAAGKEAGAAKAKPNALQTPLTPSAELAAVVGSATLSRGEVVSKMWEYIKKNDLQNPENKREIIADDKLRPIFGKDKVTMFEMNKHLAAHLS
jgi:chromatin remodeling complex protein RSC6